MILNLFRKQKALLFSTEDWKENNENGNFYLKLNLRRIKVTAHTKIYLYKQQDDRYIFMSEGFEELVGNEVVYCAQFPFSGKIRIK